MIDPDPDPFAGLDLDAVSYSGWFVVPEALREDLRRDALTGLDGMLSRSWRAKDRADAWSRRRAHWANVKATR
ncbi:MAG: hypothetical protein GY925_17690 [Actinomycetia bacterium]|nr:hypothetical protein [Actinomycetes bacterium]